MNIYLDEYFGHHTSKLFDNIEPEIIYELVRENNKKDRNGIIINGVIYMNDKAYYHLWNNFKEWVAADPKITRYGPKPVCLLCNIEKHKKQIISYYTFWGDPIAFIKDIK